MRILYMSYDGMTDPLGQSQVIPYLIGLSEKGYSITLLSCEKKDNFYKSKNKILNLLKSNGIRWKHVYYTPKPPVISTIYDIYKLRRKAKRLHKIEHFNAVHCRSYITAIVGLYFKKRYSLKFIFDMRGFYADERLDGGLWNLKNPVFNLVYKYFKYKEVQFFSEADYVISLTENGKNEIHQWKQIHGQPIPIKVIPCCADLQLFSDNYIQHSPININQIRNKLNLNETDMVISYLGSLGTWYMIDEMLMFFKRILLKYQNAKFLFITPDNEEYIISKAAKFGIVESSIRITYAAREDVPVYAALSNVSIFFIKPVFSKKASSPTKQGEIMSLGIPIICNANVGDSDFIINETQTGFVINDFTNKEFDKAVDSIKVLIQIPKKRIKQTAEKYFSLEMGIKRYDEIYKKLSEEKE